MKTKTCAIPKIVKSQYNLLPQHKKNQLIENLKKNNRNSVLDINNKSKSSFVLNTEAKHHD